MGVRWKLDLGSNLYLKPICVNVYLESSSDVNLRYLCNASALRAPLDLWYYAVLLSTLCLRRPLPATHERRQPVINLTDLSSLLLIFSC